MTNTNRAWGGYIQRNTHGRTCHSPEKEAPAVYIPRECTENIKWTDRHFPGTTKRHEGTSRNAKSEGIHAIRLMGYKESITLFTMIYADD